MINLKTLDVPFSQPMGATDCVPITHASGLPDRCKLIAAWIGVVSGEWCSEIQVSINAASEKEVTVAFFNPYSIKIPTGSSGPVPNITATIVMAYE